MAVRNAMARWQRALRIALSRVEVLALFPILVLLSQEIGGPGMVVAAAMILPSLLVLQNLGSRTPHHLKPAEPVAPGTSSVRAGRRTMISMLERIAAMPGVDSACLALEIDDWDAAGHRWGAETARDIHDRCGERIRAALRADDLVADLGAGRFGVVLHPIAAARLGIRDAVADRLRSALSQPIMVGETSLRLTASIGHAALVRSSPDPATATASGAFQALQEARAAGPNSVRSFVPGRTPPRRDGSELAGDIGDALACGAIQAWFQPQIDARTGGATGFEALARWQHPALGLLGPARFLDAVDTAGRLPDLGALIRRNALAALAGWDPDGARGLTVSVNACAAELRDPDYADQVAWDLDAAGIAPERLVVEVLETVAADARDDEIMATLGALRSQGVSLDLDDFGVGQASLLSIRRFGVGRIKIDRSFVIGVDRDAEQQAMVAGIVSLARGMGLSTLAEGVETPGQRAALASMGCAYLQGFGIGKPMPLDAATEWLRGRAGPALPVTRARTAASPGQ